MQIDLKYFFDQPIYNLDGISEDWSRSGPIWVSIWVTYIAIYNNLDYDKVCTVYKYLLYHI